VKRLAAGPVVDIEIGFEIRFESMLWRFERKAAPGGEWDVRACAGDPEWLIGPLSSDAGRGFPLSR